MLFDFPVMQAMYLSLARQDAVRWPRRSARRSPVPEDCQWAKFVRNHDELTLDQLTDSERQEVFAAFGPDEDMQLFGRGLRRRLPSMLDGDQQRIRLAYSLLFSLPGTPVLFYGEEIGMGENLDIPGRMSVRTPMQWTDETNGGFSPARPSRLRRPVAEGRFGPLAVNVAEQRRDPDSLLNWLERMIRRRRETPELGWGEWRVVAHRRPAVLAHRCDWEGRAVVPSTTSASSRAWCFCSSATCRRTASSTTSSTSGKRSVGSRTAHSSSRWTATVSAGSGSTRPTSTPRPRRSISPGAGRARYRRQRSGTPLSSYSPASSRIKPPPATRSLTVDDTRTSEGPATALTRAPMWTPIPPTLPSIVRPRPCGHQPAPRCRVAERPRISRAHSRLRERVLRTWRRSRRPQCRSPPHRAG